MATATETRESSERQGERPAWVAPLGTLGVFLLAILGVLAATDKLDEAASAATAVGGWIGSFLVAIVPAIVAAFIPSGKDRNMRWIFAIVTFALALFMAHAWDGAVAEDGQVTESGHVLSAILALPLLGGVFILFLPRQAHRLLRGFTLLVMFGTLAACLPLLTTPMTSGFVFDENVMWIERFGIRYHVALDGVSYWLVLLSAFIMPIAAYASFGSIEKRIKDWCFALLILQGAMIGAFVSLDLFLFYVFWELMLVPMYLMIGVWGSTNRVKAAIKFFLYTMFGSVLMLGAIIYLARQYAELSGGQLSFDYFELQRVLLPRDVQMILFGAFALSFLIKVPMWPVHTWLPDAHTEAPTGGSVILAAVLLKMGTYGYVRFCLGLFPEASAESAATLAGFAVMGGILYGALCAWKQNDVKRLVAYSSVAHLGYVMLGVFAATPAALEGAVLQMVNHGISTGALFMLVGVIYDRRHTREVDEFGGLAKVMPVYAAMFIIATLASIGLPGTNGFVGEFMIITGTFVSKKLGHMNGVQAAGAAIGVILGALYMLSVVQKMFFGPITRPENKDLPDMNRRELIAVVPLVFMIFAIGLFPNAFLNPMKGATTRIVGDLQSRIEAHAAPLYYQGEPKLMPRRPEAPPIPGATQNGDDGAATEVNDAPEGDDPHAGLH